MIENSIAVLCRGESLKEIELLPEVEEYIIVNGFSDEFEQQTNQKIRNSFAGIEPEYIKELDLCS